MPYLRIPYCSSISADTIELPTDSRAWLNACYDAIGCQTIEVVHTSWKHDVVLIIDEEGKCWDEWADRINPRATQLYGCIYDVIVGDVLVGKVKGEDIVPLTPSELASLASDYRIRLD